MNKTLYKLKNKCRTMNRQNSVLKKTVRRIKKTTYICQFPGMKLFLYELYKTYR